jgi:cardiolipin synthase
LLGAQHRSGLHQGLRAAIPRSLAQSNQAQFELPDQRHVASLRGQQRFAIPAKLLRLLPRFAFECRSLFINYELMMAFHATADVQRFAALWEMQRQEATSFTAEAPGWIRDSAEGMVLWLGFQL